MGRRRGSRERSTGRSCPWDRGGDGDCLGREVMFGEPFFLSSSYVCFPGTQGKKWAWLKGIGTVLGSEMIGALVRARCCLHVLFGHIPSLWQPSESEVFMQRLALLLIIGGLLVGFRCFHQEVVVHAMYEWVLRICEAVRNKGFSMRQTDNPTHCLDITCLCFPQHS